MSSASPIVLSFELSENSLDMLAERIALKSLELAGMTTHTKTPENAPEASQELQEGSETGDEADPWVKGSAQESAAQTSNAPAATAGGVRVVTKETQYGPMKFELGLNNAPLCGHDEPSARVTKTKKAGGTYSKWVCAKDAGADWKAKCGMDEWA